MNLREITGRVNAWASWYLRLESSGLGYPSCTAESHSHTGSNRRPGPIVPNMVMNSRAAEVDRVIRYMPQDMAALIMHKHVYGTGNDVEKAKQFCKKHSVSMSSYYRREKDAYWFIGGALSAVRNAS